ncbi:cysteine rich repeat-containing protein, partial [Acinetobacter baumannii]
MPGRIVLVAMLLLVVAGQAAAQVTPDQKERARTLARACRADAQKFCQGIDPGGGRLLTCLKGREADLSAGCRDALK